MEDQDPVTLPQEPAALPMEYRRDIRIENVVLDRTDIVNLMSLVQSKTNDAQELQFATENEALFESREKLEEEVRRVFRINYNIHDFKDNMLSGYDVINLDTGGIPENIKSVYISNINAFKTAASGRLPRNGVDIFVDFKRPSMAINFLNMPSNPTDNKSVANVFGLDEDWVISTHQKLREFLDSRKTKRSFIHRSGVYDLFLYVIYIPILLWGAFRIESNFSSVFVESSVVFLAAIYIYGFVLSLVSGRVIFQYLRWLFPIVEYSPKRSMAYKVHRRVIGFILSGLGIAILYDVIRTVFS